MKNTKKSERKPEQKAPASPAMAKVPWEPEPASGGSFPIVGIGASAGGLAAFEAFFSAMPPDSDCGMAFVLVQHLAPDHKSILTDLIKRYTLMKVFEVEDGMAVEPNCAYIIPPNRDMAFQNGRLQLLEPSAPRGQRLPIDFFFRSLAQEQHERAIGIILSGTGSDGTLGMRAIKAEGGMIMAQKPESAEFDGMPRSAIATGLVDFVLPPAEMPAQLIAYGSHVIGKALHPVQGQPHKAGGCLRKVFTLLRAETGHDFSHYKQNTILRRIERRMAVHQVDSIEGYVRYMEQTPSEVNALFYDLLIGVTNFFRDPDAFEALREQIIPALFADKPPGASVRVWVPGCSTGEEAYSIAILLHEYMETLKHNYKVQVFATDIDPRAIEQARTGIFPHPIADDVSPERLARYFYQNPNSNSYQVQKCIRDLLVVSEQDIIRDPPFSRLDLISCRNLLIYMDAALQKKLIPLFHYALNPNGFLFLGTSEGVGDFVELFSTLDRKAKLYQRKESMHRAHGQALGEIFPAKKEEGTVQRQAAKALVPKVPPRELMERTLLQHFAAVGALINERGDILYLHGRTGYYLEPAPGEPGMNILKMAREGLRRELTIALHKSILHRQPVGHAGLRVKTNGHFTKVNLTVRPVEADPEHPQEQPLYLVILEEAPPEMGASVHPGEAAGLSGAEVDARIAELKKELQIKEDYLQSTNEELETSNEELKSSNEEMQSMNEELQSTNEELETSKEELQSVNEELATVNSELQTKVADLSRANNDMNNLLAGTGVGTIFVDCRQHIQRFTPTITHVINLIVSDVGRPVGHVVSNLLGYDRLVEDVQSVLDTLIPKEVEVQAKSGAWFLLGIRPYRTLENVIEGAVITFVDITALKKAQKLARDTEALRRLAVVVRDSNDAITVQDLEGRILAWNPCAEKLYGWSEAEALKRNIRDMLPEAQRAGVRERLQSLARNEKLEPYRMQRLAKDGQIVKVWVTATALVDEAHNPYGLVTTERRAKE